MKNERGPVGGAGELREAFEPVRKELLGFVGLLNCSDHARTSVSIRVNSVIEQFFHKVALAALAAKAPQGVPARDFTRPEGLYLKFSDYDYGTGVDQNTPVVIERVNGDCSVSEFIIARDEAGKLVGQLSEFLREAAAPKPAPPTFEVPFQKPLTVLLVKDRSQEQASADIAAIKKNDRTVLGAVSELYFHQLRLECAKDPTLLDKIAVFYRDENNVLHAIGLRFEDELRWPPGFLQEALDLELAIRQVRHPALAAPKPAPPPDEQIIYAQHPLAEMKPANRSLAEKVQDDGDRHRRVLADRVQQLESALDKAKQIIHFELERSQKRGYANWIAEIERARAVAVAV